MAEKKIVSAKTKSKTDTSKSTGLNIDLSELKKIGSAFLAFVASNPELISKLLDKPAAYLKKIVNGEDVSKTTKKTVNKTIDDNKSGGIGSILTSLSNLSGGDKETTNLFGDLSKSLSKTSSSGVDVSTLIKGASSLLGGSTSTKKTKKAKKTTADSSNILGSLFKSLFK